MFLFLLILTLFKNVPLPQVFYEVSFSPRRPPSQGPLSSCVGLHCVFSRWMDSVAECPKPIPSHMIRPRQQSHFQGGLSQTPSLKSHHPLPLPVPSSALSVTLAHFTTQHTAILQTCLSSVYLDGSFWKAGTSVCFIFCFIPSAKKGTCT